MYKDDELNVLTNNRGESSSGGSAGTKHEIQGVFTIYWEVEVNVEVAATAKALSLLFRKLVNDIHNCMWLT